MGTYKSILNEMVLLEHPKHLWLKKYLQFYVQIFGLSKPVGGFVFSPGFII